MPLEAPEPLWAFLSLWALCVVGLVYLLADASILQKGRDAIRARTGRVSRFVSRLLECRPCCSPWVAPLAGWVSWGVWLVPGPLAPTYGLLVAGPVASLGLTVILTILSPSSAVGLGFRELDKRRGS